jgi:hypothetical protein
MTATMNKFDQDLQVLEGIREESVNLFEKYDYQHRTAKEDLFDYLNESDAQGDPFFFSKWMEKYFKFELILFGKGTPQNATLGAELEFAVRSIIKKKFPQSVPEDFVSSHKNTQYELGRMEIAIQAGNSKIFVQVKRGFDSPTWKRVIDEKNSVEGNGDRYLLVSPTEYTNEKIRSEIREKHLWKWVFLWKENCWRTPVYNDWMERFLEVLGNSLE